MSIYRVYLEEKPDEATTYHVLNMRMCAEEFIREHVLPTNVLTEYGGRFYDVIFEERSMGNSKTLVRVFVKIKSQPSYNLASVIFSND